MSRRRPAPPAAAEATVAAAEHGANTSSDDTISDLLRRARAVPRRAALAASAAESEPASDEDTFVSVAGGDVLVERAAAGDMLQVLALLEAGAAPADAVDAGGEPALCAAARAGSAETVLVLLCAGADPLSRSAFGESALHAAALSPFPEGAAVVVREVLQRAGDDSSALAALADARGLTALASAAKLGVGDVVRALLVSGVHAQEHLDGALWEAAKWGRGNTIGMLVAAGAEPRAPVHATRAGGGSGGESALDAARASGDRTVEAALCEALAARAERRANVLEAALEAARAEARDAAERAEHAEHRADQAEEAAFKVKLFATRRRVLADTFVHLAEGWADLG